jgi:hypothetical protein
MSERPKESCVPDLGFALMIERLIQGLPSKKNDNIGLHDY